MTCGGSPLPSQVEPFGLHSAPTPPHKTPRPMHAIAGSRHWVAVGVPPSPGSGTQSQVDGSLGSLGWQGRVHWPLVTASREHAHVCRKHCDGIWQPVTMMA